MWGTGRKRNIWVRENSFSDDRFQAYVIIIIVIIIIIIHSIIIELSDMGLPINIFEKTIEPFASAEIGQISKHVYLYAFKTDEGL